MFGIKLTILSEMFLLYSKLVNILRGQFIWGSKESSSDRMRAGRQFDFYRIPPKKRNFCLWQNLHAPLLRGSNRSTVYTDFFYTYHITGPDWAPKVAKKFTRNKGGPNVSRIFMEKLLGGPMWAGGLNVGRFLFPHISSLVYSLLVL